MHLIVNQANTGFLTLADADSGSHDDIDALADGDATSEIQTEDMIARPGQFLRAQPQAPRGMALLLPPPNSTDPGATVRVSLERPGAPLRVSCVPNQGNGAQVTAGTVNGQSRASFTVAGLIEFTSNGDSAWVSQTEHPAESAAITIASVTAIAAAVPVSTWAQVLRAGLSTGGRTPRIDAGDALAFASGATGITAAGDLLVDGAGAIELESVTDMHLHAGGELHLGHEDLTTFIHQGSIGTIELVAGGDYTCQASGDVTMSADGFWQVSTGATNRLQIDTTGAWLLFGDSGTANDVLTSQGPGAPPLWVDPTTLVPTPSWSGVLGVDEHTNGNTPIVDSGDRLVFASGSLGISAAATLDITAANSLAEAAGADWFLSTGGFVRFWIDAAGEWIVPSGASGQFLRHQGAGTSPVWATFALTDLPSQAADTFLGRLAGAGSPTEQLLSDIDSTSIIYDAVSHTFQRAAVGGVIGIPANTNTATFDPSVPGAGLTLSGGDTTLNVGAGTGITVNVNDVAWDGATPLIPDGDKGHIVVSASGATWLWDTTISIADSQAITLVNNLDIQAGRGFYVNAVRGILLNAGSLSGLEIDSGDVAINASGGVGIHAGSTPITGAGTNTLDLSADGDVVVSAGDDLRLNGLGGSMLMAMATPDTAQTTGQVKLSADSSVRILTNGTERLEIESDGAWQVGGDTGSAGEVLTSAGGSAPPVWAAPTTVAGAIISPTAISADQNNYNPTSWSTAAVVRLSTNSGATRNLTGAQAGANGELKWLINLGPGTVQLNHQSGSSTAANRWFLSSGTNFGIIANGVAGIIYDNASAGWRLIVGNFQF